MRWPPFIILLLAAAASRPALATVCSNSVEPPLTCGATLLTDLSTSDGNAIGQYGCVSLDQNGAERIFPFECDRDELVLVRMLDTQCDLDLYVVNESCDTLADCLDADVSTGVGAGIQGSVFFNCRAGETRYIIVEGWALLNNPISCRRQGATGRRSDFDLLAICGERCGDGLDNDLDGLTDCADSDCSCPEDCTTPGDEDGDGDADCADSDCAAEPICCDLDGDGFLAVGVCGGDDCADDAALVFPGQAELPVNGVDEDCDGGDTCYADADGDGYGSTVLVAGDNLDCTDGAGEADNDDDCYDNPQGGSRAYPGAPEIAGDGLDQDCDGVDHCYRDRDEDGFGVEPAEPGPGIDCDASPTWSAVPGDCLDQGTGAFESNPLSQEVCDAIDNDCDGLVDADDPDLSNQLTVYPDGDGDGYGVSGQGTVITDCVVPAGFAAFANDCDDTDAGRNPGVPEVPYDGVDQDCVGGDLDDIDGDGVPGPSLTGPDCDDTDASVAPSRPEIPNGIDDNCSGAVDELTDWIDDDGDGFAEQGGDCDDADALASPVGVEICNGVDDDCDTVTDEGTECFDDDGDGYTELQGDCIDSEPGAYPGALEDLGNGIDDDCDGFTDVVPADRDMDGWADFAGDCDDDDPAVFPLAPELPNGIDDDCDNRIDEGTELYDDDGDGWSEVLGDCHDRNDEVFPGAEELRNGVDDDCDGVIDDVGEGADADRDGYTGFEGDCNDADATINPGAAELDDGIDQDCDGLIDEGVHDVDEDGWTLEAGDCDDENGWVRPDAAEVRDGLDNDCDDQIDEGFEIPQTSDPDDDRGCRTAPGAAGSLLLLLPWMRRRRAAG